MKNLIILTERFPYEGGEQFLETEIAYWENTLFDKVYILPKINKGDLRCWPESVALIDKESSTGKLAYLLLAIVNSMFYKELFYILRSRAPKFWLGDIVTALKATAVVVRESRELKKALLPYLGKSEITIYSYWNDASFYAACILKKEGLVKRVVSRAHGFDLYENRKRNGYMPIKRQYAKGHDGVYLLSVGAVDYYHKTYGAKLNDLNVARLGVKVSPKLPLFERSSDSVSVLSISYCVEVKQIHKTMEALSLYAAANQNLKIEWVHIGGGPLYEILKKCADRIVKKQDNLEIEFVGHLDNKEVMDFLSAKRFDFFINSSKSEGTPVSIMEAMSHGIPTIAPDVGGIAELVGGENGYLMPADIEPANIIFGINAIQSGQAHTDFRGNARQRVVEKFNADINYPWFVKELERVAGFNE